MVKQMRIVQINVTYGNADSTGRNVKEFHEYLLSKGVDSEVYVSVINGNSEKDGRIHLFSSQFDKRMHAFLSRLTGKQGYFSKKSTHQLILELKRNRADVIILHVLHSNCVNFPMLFDYLSQENIPVIVVLHDCWYYTGHCCHYTSVGCDKWKNRCGRCPQIHQWNKSWFFDHSINALDDKRKWFSSIQRLGVIGVSDWITNEARQSILQCATLIQRVYNWVDLEVFKPKNSKILRDSLEIPIQAKVLLGVASRWGEQKGLQEVLLVSQSLPDVKVVVIGHLPQNMRVPENMICVGIVESPDKLAEYYSMANVFLNPSYQETFGKTTAEALSCGTPAVVYNTTACPELIAEGCGKVVPAFNKTLFVECVRQQLSESSELTATQCRKFATRTFSASNCMKEYENVGMRLLEKHIEK